MDKIETNRDNCAIQMTADLIADKWIFLILRELFLGNTKFDDFQKNLNISKSVLSSKLKNLINNDIIIKRQYKNENSRPRLEYKLSPKGHSLIYIMGAIMEWGNKNLVNNEEEFLKLTDSLGNSVRLVFTGKNKQEISLEHLKFELS